MLDAAFNSVAGFDDGSDTPKSYKDVLKHENQKGWWDPMKEAFLTMYGKLSMPPGRKIIGNRWVYNEKDDGNLRSRTVAQGFSKVPGQDFTNSHAPVLTDLAFRLALIT
jgi:Reverse transcriptase (RNA-dependent DNA polymerase)